MPTLIQPALTRELTTLTADVLQALGDTADEVAAALRASRITGVLNTVRILNPIVRYVLFRLGGTARSAHVIKRNVICVSYADGTMKDTPLPDSVTAFQRAFDLGSYPDLIQP